MLTQNQTQNQTQSARFKVLQQQDQAVLVEWRDSENNLQRSIVPSDAMSNVPEEEIESVLAAGISFGVHWDLMLSAPLAARLANRLHELGFWTYIDATRRVRDFRACVLEVVAASLLDTARDAARGETIQ